MPTEIITGGTNPLSAPAGVIAAPTGGVNPSADPAASESGTPVDNKALLTAVSVLTETVGSMRNTFAAAMRKLGEGANQNGNGAPVAPETEPAVAAEPAPGKATNAQLQQEIAALTTRVHAQDKIEEKRTAEDASRFLDSQLDSAIPKEQFRREHLIRIMRPGIKKGESGEVFYANGANSELLVDAVTRELKDTMFQAPSSGSGVRLNSGGAVSTSMAPAAPMTMAAFNALPTAERTAMDAEIDAGRVVPPTG